MADFQLAVRRPDINEEQFRKFTKEVERTEEITNEELLAAERDQTNQEIFDFTGFEDIDEFADAYADIIEELEEITKEDVIKAEELQAETDDPFLIKEFEAEQVVFQRKQREEEKEKQSKLNHSSSTDYVKTEKSSSYYQPSKGTTSYYGNNGYGSTTKTNQTNKTKQPDEPKKVAQDFGFISGRVQDVAAQKISGWNEKPKEEGWGSWTKPTWKRKIKNFFKTKKARILLKTGMLMTLQLGMAIVGKKYEFEGMGQMVMFLSLMMGVFYLTRELVEDGFDPRGFGIL